jgi:hypothetical protein
MPLLYSINVKGWNISEEYIYILYRWYIIHIMKKKNTFCASLLLWFSKMEMWMLYYMYRVREEGERQFVSKCRAFEKTWPKSITSKMTGRVFRRKKKIKVEGGQIYIVTLIYTRIIYPFLYYNSHMAAGLYFIYMLSAFKPYYNELQL